MATTPTLGAGLLGNSAWNALGTAAPVIIAIPSMGWLARALGTEKFGLLTLAFALVGYFAILDLGIARSVCWLVAQEPANGTRHRAVLGTSVVASLTISCCAACLMFGFAEHLVRLVNVTPLSMRDAVIGTRVLSLTLPFLVVTTILQAFLEGLQRFKDVSLQRATTGVLISVFPVALTMVTPSLTMAIWGLVAARVFGAGLAYVRLLGFTSVRMGGFDPRTFKHMLRYSGWIAVSNFVYPLTGYIDRFWLSHRGGASNVAVYSAPSELVARAMSLPVAVSRALFPAISNASTTADQREAASRRATLLIFFTSGPIACAFLVFARPLVSIWLGAEIASDAARVLQILSIGYLVNSLAQIPFSVLHARGDSRATAIIHAAEVLPYLIVLVALGRRFGASGVALAWTFRVCADYAALTILARWRTSGISDYWAAQ